MTRAGGAAKQARNSDIKRALERVRAKCDVADRRARDPVDAVHAFTEAADQEIVALVAACIAFGNVKTIRAKMRDLADRLGPRPSQVADDELDTFARLHGWVHRVFRGEDIARLIIGARRLQRRNGSLGVLLSRELAKGASFREALGEWVQAIRDAGGLSLEAARSKRRGPVHLLADPRRSSGSKRLFLFLRWMIRPADGVDLGLWNGLEGISPAILLCPVDTHIHKLARNLGFTRRKDLSWATTEEITLALTRLDPRDPVKYDFSLCHMGMLQRCPSRRDPKRCEGCGVKPVCRHWQKTEQRSDQNAPLTRSGSPRGGKT